MPKKFRGVMLDERTVRMVMYAETLAGFEFDITQGSYNQGGVAASAGTHDGGGVVDFSVKGLTVSKRLIVLNALKDTGFAAWLRPARPGVWNAHIHAVAIGCPDLAPIARRQIVSFDAGRDGLAGNQKDPSYRPSPPRVFSMVWGKPIARKKSRFAAVRSAVPVNKVK